MSNEPGIDWADERTEAEVLAERSVIEPRAGKAPEELSPAEVFAQFVRKALG